MKHMITVVFYESWFSSPLIAQGHHAHICRSWDDLSLWLHINQCFFLKHITSATSQVKNKTLIIIFKHYKNHKRKHWNKKSALQGYMFISQTLWPKLLLAKLESWIQAPNCITLKFVYHKCNGIGNKNIYTTQTCTVQNRIRNNCSQLNSVYINL